MLLISCQVLYIPRVLPEDGHVCRNMSQWILNFVNSTNLLVIGGLLKHGLRYRSGMKSAPKYGFAIAVISNSGKFLFLVCEVPHVPLLSCKGITALEVSPAPQMSFCVACLLSVTYLRSRRLFSVPFILLYPLMPFSFRVHDTAPCCSERSSSSHSVSQCCAVCGLMFVRCTVVWRSEGSCEILFLSLSSDCPKCAAFLFSSVFCHLLWRAFLSVSLLQTVMRLLACVT
jgi:hypothetical protein